MKNHPKPIFTDPTLRGRLVGLALVSPALFGFAVMGQIHHTKPPFQFVKASDEQTAHLLAYAGLVKESRNVLNWPLSERTTDAARKIAGDWLAGVQDGRLTLLRPVTYDDSVQDGPKGEVFRAASGISMVLDRWAEREAEAGDHAAAARDAWTAFQLQQSLKYCDLTSVNFSSMGQRRSLRLLTENAKALPASERTTLVAQLKEATDIQPLLKVAALARYQYVRKTERDGGPVLTASADKFLQSMDQVLAQGPTEATERQLRQDIYAHNGGFSAPDVIGSVALGYTAEVELQQTVEQAVQALQSA